MSFNKLGLSAELLRSISEKGYKAPTPVQSQAIPHILKGKDAVVSAQMGTGKTAPFTLPISQRLAKLHSKNNANKKSVQAFVLTPTRELATQEKNKHVVMCRQIRKNHSDVVVNHNKKAM